MRLPHSHRKIGPTQGMTQQGLHHVAGVVDLPRRGLRLFQAVGQNPAVCGPKAPGQRSS